MEELRLLLEKYLNQELVQIIISGPRKSQEENKVRIRPVLLKGERKFQAETFRGPKAFHENLEKEEAVEKILLWMAESFKQLQLTSETGMVNVLVSKKGKVTIKEKQQATGVKAPELTHNKKKRYLLEEGKRPQAENGRLPADGHFVPAQVDKDSIMTVIATDLPVTSRQLERIARRAGAGLARTGSFIGHGSGEIMLAFSTANVIRGEEPFMDVKSVREDLMDLAFRAVAEATNEAVLSSMLHAKTAYGLDGRVWYSLADFELFEKK